MVIRLSKIGNFLARNMQRDQGGMVPAAFAFLYIYPFPTNIKQKGFKERR